MDSAHSDTPRIDHEKVERLLRRASGFRWDAPGRVDLLVETPEPHRHAVRKSVDVIVGKGFAGDHAEKSFYRGRYVPGREVSAVAAEVLELLDVEPSVVGDNLITRGIDLSRLEEGDRLIIGEVVLERSGRPHRPCTTFRSRTSSEAFAVVSRDNLRGALFVVVGGGTISTGDRIRSCAKRVG